ncbi:hypothetical protein B0J17DRAFT_707653 [Rhizoctonia solani]|nr:hypothetical protein B0J17DRAFT_707653 [Rhizoctonia solani]
MFPKITHQHSHRMDSELATIVSYYTMLRRAEQAIGQFIPSPPPELVTRTFYFALAPEPFEPDWSADPKGVGFPKKYPITSHSHQGHLPRALLYTARSSRLPLHLYIPEDYGIEEYDPALFQFITSIASRTSALEYHSGRQKCMGLVFKGLFSALATGALTTLVTNSTSGHLNSILLTPETWTDLDEHGLTNMSLYLDIPEGHLEALLAPLTVLHLRAIFPRWSSLAYHNLVDLRLTSAFRPNIAAVPLKELEEVNIKTVCTYAKVLKVGSILWLLAPGTRPLRLTIENAVYKEGTSLDETVRFFERSNIARFCAKEGYPPIKILLPHAPSLQYLVFSSCKYLSRSNLDLPNQAEDVPGRHIEFVDNYDTWSLVLSNCHIFKPNGQRPLGEDHLFEFTQCVDLRSYDGSSPDLTAD